MRRLRGKRGGVERKRGKWGVMWKRTHRNSAAFEREFVFDDPFAESFGSPGDKLTVELTGEIVDVVMMVGVVQVELPTHFPGAVVVRVAE